MFVKSSIISEEEFDILFPFFFRLDSNLNITKAGHGLLKLFPDILQKNFPEYFSFKRPHSVSLFYNSILEYIHQIIIIQATQNNLLFRGQILELKSKDMLFVGSPWITSAEGLKKYNLLLTDFALHDTITDMLQLLKSNEIVMNDMKRLVVNLNLQKEELVKVNQLAEQSKLAKQQFIANMSHEIRTPLNAIIGMADVLMDENLTDDQKDSIEAIKLSSENLLSIINDILDFSKIEAGKMGYEYIAFSVVELLEGIVQMLSFSAAKRKISLSYSISHLVPENLMGAPLRIKQVLINLIGNAIKFTEENGEVWIKIEVEKNVDDQFDILFSVADTGIGIPENKIQSIFESFTQISADYNRKYGGTGLGLAIVKEMVKGMGGNIAVKSIENEGSVFNLVLPLIRCKIQSNKNQNDNKKLFSDNELENARILLVEDNQLNQELVSKLLNKWKTDFCIVENGALAIEALLKNKYDLILMDIQMPEMDGYEATQKIRSHMNAGLSKTPIIAMTAHAFAGEAEKCLANGMNDYISKPFNKNDLYNKMAKILLNKNNVESAENQFLPEIEQKKKIADLSYLRAIDSKEEFIVRMINLFCEQTPSILSLMKECLQNKEWHRLSRLAHKMKASVNLMGIQSIKDDVLKLEMEAKDQKDIGQGHILMLKIESVCKEVIDEFKQYR
jgi:signal transduction histidine kinase/CheY-like chemotaxis protein